jgi:hypothetical protein
MLQYMLTPEGNIRAFGPDEKRGVGTPLTPEQAEKIIRSRIGASEEIWRFNLREITPGGPSSEFLPSSHSMPSSGGFIEPHEREDE